MGADGIPDEEGSHQRNHPEEQEREVTGQDRHGGVAPGKGESSSSPSGERRTGQVETCL